MKWTESNKLLLLLKAIGNSGLKGVNYDYIAETWPTADSPSPRAVRDNVCALLNHAKDLATRAEARVGEKKEEDCSGAESKLSLLSPVRKTPGKRAKRAPTTSNSSPTSTMSRKSASSSRKRKRMLLSDDDDDRTVCLDMTDEDSACAIEDSPTPHHPTRRSSRAAKKVDYGLLENDPTEDDEFAAVNRGDDTDEDPDVTPATLRVEWLKILPRNGQRALDRGNVDLDE